MWWKKGQTVGMMALNLKIVRAVDGGPIGGQAAFIRFIDLCGRVNPMLSASSGRRSSLASRPWHDKAATVVIHTK
jgi:uncharacterized RDD family membrane protein YckC